MSSDHLKRPSASSQTEIPTLRKASKYFVRLVGLIRPYWGALLKSMSLGLFIGVIGMVSPYLSKLLIDEVYPSQDVTLMHILVGGILALSVSTRLVGAIQGYYSMYVNTRLSNALQLLFFNHLQHLPMRFFDDHRVGEILSRFRDVGSSLGSVTHVFQTVLVQGIYLFIVPPILFFLHWQLALIAVIGIPLTAIITTLSGRLLRKYWKRSAEVSAELSAFQVETLSHIRTLKALAREHRNYYLAKEQVQEVIQTQLKASGYGQLLGLANGMLHALNAALFIWFGWSLILSQELTLGTFIAFSAYIGFLYNPVTKFLGLYSQFQQAAVNLDRMFEYLDCPAEQSPTLAYAPPPPIQTSLVGHIRMTNVFFGYTPDHPVLRNITLEVPAGSLTAIVGPSGSGKTSLLRLLVGMASPDQGQITIDGHNIEAISLPDLRRQISVVWQEFGLIKGTIWDNLILGLDSPPARQRVDEIIALCQLNQLMDALPQGYQTPVAEWGASLSGGQRQRLAIARALIRDTPIFLLDEATANIDVQTEQDLLHGIFDYLKDRTILWVTHRINTTSLADQICILENGALADVGSHRDLLARNGDYNKLYHSASGPSPAYSLRTASRS